MLVSTNFALLFIGLIYSVEAALSSVELSAMQELFLSTSGGNWTWQKTESILTHWNFDGYHDPCADGWEYLIYTDDQQHIGKFNFSYNNMVGTLPESVGNFSELSVFTINWNFNLVGSLPHTMTRLSTLINLLISQTRMSGTIPQAIWNLTNLEHFSFYQSSFSGFLPKGLNKLKNLTAFNFGLSNFNSDAVLTEEICGLPLLTQINFNYNFFGGPYWSLLLAGANRS